MHIRNVCLLTLVVAAAACNEQFPVETPTVIASQGAHVEIRLRPFSLRLIDDSGALVAQTITDTNPADPNGNAAATLDTGPDGVTVIDGWDGYHPDEGAWEHAGEGLISNVTDSHASVALLTPNGRIDIDLTVDGNKVSIKEVVNGHMPGNPSQVWNKTTMAFQLRDQDHFFGLGERYATMDHRGWDLYSWAEEGGISRGEDVPPSNNLPENPEANGPSMTYFPVPFLLTPQGYALHLDTTRRTETHLGSERPDAWRVAVNGTELDMVFYINDDPMKSIDNFTRDTGRPNVPAPWVFGPRFRIGLGQQVNGVPEWQLLRTNNVPTTTLDDALHFLPHSSEIGMEAEYAAWTDQCHQNGFKAVAYNTPYVSQSDPASASIYQYGVANGYFLKDDTGNAATVEFSSGVFQTVSSIDLTNPAAVSWYQGLLQRTLDLGYDGWMNDFGEYTRRTWTAFDGSTGETLHNLLPVLSAKAAYELLQVQKPDDYLFYVRSGYTGSGAVGSTAWGGDAEATFDRVQGLPAMLRGGLNLGMSGFPIWGSDTSGYKCLTDAPRDKDVYLRWAEFSAVCPIMEEENACATINGVDGTKWYIWNDAETTTTYGAMARLHTRLQPYFLLLAQQAHLTGAPIMRHPMLMFPHEENTWAIDDAFFVGPGLYAMPVVQRATYTKTEWMPPGRYTAIDDSTVWEGGTIVSVPAPQDRLPLFLVEDQIVPMLDPAIETLAPAPITNLNVVTPDRVSDRLDVLLAIGQGGHAELTLADGTVLIADRGNQGGNPGNVQTAANADAVATCANCAFENQEGGVDRLRLTTPNLATTNITFEDMNLIVRGNVSRRIRWDVRRLP